MQARFKLTTDDIPYFKRHNIKNSKIHFSEASSNSSWLKKEAPSFSSVKETSEGSYSFPTVAL